MLENLVTCPICAGKLPQATFAGLCPKCVLEESFQRLEATDGLLARREIHPPESYGSRPGMAIGDYELLEEIARGGMGIVYKARQVSLDRIVAVKLLLFASYSSPEFVRRFGIEAAAAASLQHPNIVAIHEVGFRDGQHFLAMDYIAGNSLAEIVRKGPLPSRQAATYVKTTAEAIHYAHEHGLLHRDLKPSNVLIDGFDQPKITDFGLAKRLDPDSQLSLEESQLTLTGQVLGSPSYMPPEQAAAKRGEASRGSDVYSLGAILYHLVTGQPPFHTGSVAETLQQVLHHEPAPPRSRCAGVPRALETICLKCLEKDPARRYSTAQEMADELGRFLRDEPILARPTGQTEKVWRWMRRNPAVAAVVLIIALATTFLTLERRQRGKAMAATVSQGNVDQNGVQAGDARQPHSPYTKGHDAESQVSVSELLALMPVSDHQGKNFIPENGQEISGRHINVQNFIVPNGVTVNVPTLGLRLWIEARTIVIAGALNADFAGYLGAEAVAAGGKRGITAASAIQESNCWRRWPSWNEQFQWQRRWERWLAWKHREPGRDDC